MDYVGRGAPAAAAKLGERIVRAPRRLARSPRIGSRVPEYDRDDLREILVKPYRIIDAIREGACFVVAVVHGRRDLVNRLRLEDVEDRS